MIGRGVCCKSLSLVFWEIQIASRQIQQCGTIYNKTKSASNYKGYLKHRDAPGMYYQPSESIATGSVNSETIPRSFMAASDPRRGLDMPVQSTKAKQCPNVH